ncbi:MAG: CAP domain-containing protein [Elainella sp. Prado103]|jgi:uncharacterized protein YkwD|nr:CAP domain-containing protein [Elainella sp. Prado103]
MRSANSLRSATNVNLPLGQRRYQGVLGDQKPNHAYRIQLTQRSSLNVQLTGLRSNANLILMNGQGKAMARSARQGRRNEQISRRLEPGTYYIQVARQQGNTRYQLQIAQNSTSTPTPPTTATQPLSFAEQVVGLVNQERRQAGLKEVRLNPRLNASAQAHSQDMALNDFFGHKGSNGSQADERILAAGYNYSLIGENIAAGFATPSGAVEAWMNSPGHRQNILHPLLKEIGIGFYFLENDTGAVNYRYYWTQNFGTPL